MVSGLWLSLAFGGEERIGRVPRVEGERRKETVEDLLVGDGGDVLGECCDPFGCVDVGRCVVD